MHKTEEQTAAFLDVFLPLVPSFPTGTEVVIAPPFTALSAARERMRSQSLVELGAQNVHWEPQGAYTGEISIPMLAEHGVRYVIVGHSERRTYFHELDLSCHLKVRALLQSAMTPILACGETLEEREAGMTDERVVSQVRHALDGLNKADAARVVVAYEPVWAIGTGRNCDPTEANRVMGVIRSYIPALEDVPILYGGSMKAENAAAYFAQPNVDGGLVGGASLDPLAFAALIAQSAPLV